MRTKGRATLPRFGFLREALVATVAFEGAVLPVFVVLVSDARIRVTRVLASGACFDDGAFLVAKITLQIKKPACADCQVIL